MSDGRAYGVYDYGEGVYGQSAIIDAAVAISASSGGTAEGVAIKKKLASAHIVATSNVSAFGQRLRTSDAAVSASSNSSSVANRVQPAAAQAVCQTGGSAGAYIAIIGGLETISATSSSLVSSERVRTAVSGIEANGSVSANGLLVLSGVCVINAQSFVTAYPYRIFSVSAGSVVVSNMTAGGRRLWEIETLVPETWSDVPIPSQAWTPVAVENQTWVSV